MHLTYYEVLGVDAEVTARDLRAAYHARLLSAHPDKKSVSKPAPEPANSSKASGSVSIGDIKTAYATLSDEAARRAYDEELRTAFKKQGFNITGAGLDFYTLADFAETEDAGGDVTWVKDCPRCTTPASIELRECDLERGTADGSGGFQIVAPCQTCSLWITVLYEES